MRIQEVKALNHNELAILIEPKGEEEDFRFYMLKENTIEFLLPMQKLYEEKMVRYLYDITEKESFLSFSKGSRLKEARVRHFIKQLLEALVYGKEYYLDEDSYLMNPEYIYLDTKEDRYYFCYCPDYIEPIRQQLSSIIGCLMNQIDYEDMAVVKLVYQLYQMVGVDSFSTKKILSYVNNYHMKEENKRENLGLITVTPQLALELENSLNNQRERVIPELPPSPAVLPGLTTPPNPTAPPGLTAPAGSDIGLPIGTLAFILATVAFIVLFCIGYTCGVFYTPIGHQLDIKKTIIYVVVVLVVEGYLGFKTFGRSESKVVLNKTTAYRLLPCNNKVSDTICLGQYPFVVGKDKTQVNGTIIDDKVSRMHALFVMEEGKLYLQDTNSLNGTFVNENRLFPQTKQLLQVGDYVRFADAMYQLSL